MEKRERRSGRCRNPRGWLAAAWESESDDWRGILERGLDHYAEEIIRIAEKRPDDMPLLLIVLHRAREIFREADPNAAGLEDWLSRQLGLEDGEKESGRPVDGGTA